ncbi:MAG: GntR family transcriptional repressor for pyruvate dehydrogenase complex [Alteromonadaceae bacterium]
MKIKTTKVSDIIAQKLEGMVLDGTYQCGEKLPSERELARQFDVSRPSLREAIQILEAKALIVRRQGGGNYVSQKLQQGLSDPLFELMRAHPESQYDLLEFRHALEGISVYYAALRGTEADFSRIREKFAAILDPSVSGDIDLEAKAVIDFYLALVEASHNVVLLHLVRGMTSLLEQNVADNLKVIKSHSKDTSKVNKQLFAHRKNLFDAVIGKQPEAARTASNEHLAFIEETLLQADRENTRIERALRRIQQKAK